MEDQTNKCGGCTLCCKLMEAPFLHKPVNVLCRHCDEGVGCKIWPEWPDGCDTYQCLWRANCDVLPLEARPDQCGVVFEPLKDCQTVFAMVDPTDADAWQRPVPTRIITELLLPNGFAVVATDGTALNFILPDGRSLKDVESDMKTEWKRCQ